MTQMTELVTVNVRTVEENLHCVEMRVGLRLVSSGYYTDYKVSAEKDFVSVFVYSNSKNHCNHFCGDKVIEEVRKETLPKSSLDSRAPFNFWLHPNSTNIFKYKYDQDTAELYIVFKSDVNVQYVYYGVPICAYIEMFESDSKGKYFSRNIKKCYAWDKEDI